MQTGGANKPPLINSKKRKSHLSYSKAGRARRHTRRREGPKDATPAPPKWASAQQEIHRAAGRPETRCQELLIQNNVLAAGCLSCQRFSLLGPRLLKSGLAPFFIPRSTSLSLPLSLLPARGVNAVRISCWKAPAGSLVADQSGILVMARNMWWAGGRLHF